MEAVDLKTSQVDRNILPVRKDVAHNSAITSLSEAMWCDNRFEQIAFIKRFHEWRDGQRIVAKVDFDAIPIPEEYAAKPSQEIVRDLLGFTYMEAAYYEGIDFWDNVGYTSRSKRAEFSIEPITRTKVKAQKQVMNKLGNIVKEGEQGDPVYEFSEATDHDQGILIIAKPREYLEDTITKAQQQLTEAQKAEFSDGIRQVVEIFAQRIVDDNEVKPRDGVVDSHQLLVFGYEKRQGEKAGSMWARLVTAAELIWGFNVTANQNLPETDPRYPYCLENLEVDQYSNKLDNLIKELSSRYAAYAYIGRSIFGQDMEMPLTNLLELGHINSFNLDRGDDRLGINSLVEMERPTGVSNLLEAMHRITLAQRDLYYFRILTAQPDRKIPILGSEYSYKQIDASPFDSILDQDNLTSSDYLSLEQVKESLENNSAAVNFVLKNLEI